MRGLCDLVKAAHRFCSRLQVSFSAREQVLRKHAVMRACLAHIEARVGCAGIRIHGSMAQDDTLRVALHENASKACKLCL